MNRNHRSALALIASSVLLSAAPLAAFADVFGNGDSIGSGVASRLEKVERELRDLRAGGSTSSAPGAPGRGGLNLPPPPPGEALLEDLDVDYQVLGHVNKSHLVRHGDKVLILSTSELAKFKLKADAQARKKLEAGSAAAGGAGISVPQVLPVVNAPSVRPKGPTPPAPLSAPAANK